MSNNDDNDNDAKNAEEEEAKRREIAREEQEMAQNASGTFGLTVLNLEDLMGAYKERGEDLRDLQMMQSWGGTEGIMQKLKTDGRLGISSTDNRANDFGTNEVF
ncbi:MAG: hypothetical protein MJ252_25160, partial [archaeon]|nr:hypothetical protein [archaeon]